MDKRCRMQPDVAIVSCVRITYLLDGEAVGETFVSIEFIHITVDKTTKESGRWGQQEDVQCILNRNEKYSHKKR